jgi:hypothetical protein
MSKLGWGLISKEDAIRTADRVRAKYPNWSAMDSAKNLAISCAYLALTPVVLLFLIALIPFGMLSRSIESMICFCERLSYVISNRSLPWQAWPVIRELHRKDEDFDVD